MPMPDDPSRHSDPSRASQATSIALPAPVRDEAWLQARHLAQLAGTLDWPAVVAMATPWVQAVRANPPPFWAMESLLREYPIASEEGLALMRLAEALLRVPDTETAIALAADQLGGLAEHVREPGQGMPATLVANALTLARRWLPQAREGATSSPDLQPRAGLMDRLGARTVVAASVRAVQLLGRQFVLGHDLEAALEEADAQRRDQPALRFSFDMLGEGARTAADAERYLKAYEAALRTLAGRARQDHPGQDDPRQNDGISIKLSALHPRFEAVQRARVERELLPRLRPLVDIAAAANLNLTVDAEESDRLELSLQVFEALAAHVRTTRPGWTGLGLAVQAYQTRAQEVVDAVIAIARTHGLRFMVRLVKGAYWDGEVKRAQELGLPGYPVFTRKEHTDCSYLNCAARLLGAPEIVPQFATHNAATIAAVLRMADAAGSPFEMQRLHGMGDGTYREVRAGRPQLPLRVYAPVGQHRDLLAYLVRRLLENGANSSFVNQLTNPQVDVAEVLRSPLRPATTGGLPLPTDLYGRARPNSAGLDLSRDEERAPLLAALAHCVVPQVPEATPAHLDAAMVRLRAAFPAWNATPVDARAAVLRRTADALQAQLPRFVALIVREGRRTLADAVAEVREAIDFCRYYANEARTTLTPRLLPGPTGERNELRMHGRGVLVCISPWNFPLAIFAGQVVAALVAGNTVAAKPAEQTPGIAQAFVALLHEHGVPGDALVLLHGPGETTGAALVAHAHCAGVCFTGSTAVARHIQRALAARDGPILPLVAETGGLNAMIVDSTALPEQVVDAVLQSAFRSAGQRCSALRLLCVQDEIADTVLAMLGGAMQELQVGEPADPATDVGPVIDAEAHARLAVQLAALQASATLLARASMSPVFEATHVAPVAFEVQRVDALKEEVFGPVLHVLRWRGDVDVLVDAINDLGYGLTLGVQTRIDARAERIAARARVGNVYVNRNIVGAVVGVQPFGGMGMSGTGPKAGGPHTLPRLCMEQTVTINTAAAGGNAALLAATAEERTRPAERGPAERGPA